MKIILNSVKEVDLIAVLFLFSVLNFRYDIFTIFWYQPCVWFLPKKFTKLGNLSSLQQGDGIQVISRSSYENPHKDSAITMQHLWCQFYTTEQLKFSSQKVS